MEAPGLGPQVEQAEVRGHVDVEGRAVELVERLVDLLPLPALGAQLSLAQQITLDAGLGGDETLGQFGFGHFQREEGDRPVLLNRDVLGDVGDEGGLADRGPGGEDDQVRRLKATGLLVEIVESGRHPGSFQLTGDPLVQAIGFVEEHVAQLAEVALLLLVGDLEELGLGPFRKRRRIGLAIVDPDLDVLGRPQEPPQVGMLADDLGVMAGVAGCGDLLGQFGHVIVAAGLLQLAGGGQCLADGQ